MRSLAQVLVDNFDSIYQTCDGYCAAVGRACTNGWEEVDNTCVEEDEIGCSTMLDTNDAICECLDVAPPSPPLAPDVCDEASWPDKRDSLVCGECKVRM